MNTSPLEYNECIVLAQYLTLLENQHKIKAYTHTAQETYTKSRMVKFKNSMMGVKPGLPDYIVVTNKKVLFIEMKREKGGVVSEYQKKWIQALSDRNDIGVKVCYGSDQAIEFIRRNL